MRLDLGEVLRSRWMLLCLMVYSVLGALFVLVGMRESNVLGFTGLGRVLFSLCHALVLVLPLLALTGVGPAIVRGREEGVLELWLSQPVPRTAWLAGVSLVRFGALLGPLVLVFVLLALWTRFGLGDAIPWGFLGRALALCACLLWSFVGLGIALSVYATSLARATTLALLLWALSVALIDFALIGALLRWRLPVEWVLGLALLNPVQDARMALLAGAEPELAILGPVGFFATTRFSPSALFALGALWPGLVGTAAWLVAWRRFRRGDVV